MANKNNTTEDNAVGAAEPNGDRPTFRLPAARGALVASPLAQNIERMLDVLEQTPSSDPDLVFDLCRALIESVCKTILTDLGESIPSKPNAEILVSLVVKRFKLFLDPKSVEFKSKRAVGDTVNGINKFVRGIGEYRRLFGKASHGRDGYSESLDISHAYLVVGVTDALVGFLFSAHQRMHGEERQRAEYGDYPDFDRYLDDEHDPSPILVFGDPKNPSEVLYAVNQQGYIKRLNDWRKMVGSQEMTTEDEQ